MKTLRFLEELTGEVWTGISFHFETVPDSNPADGPMRLCEAISKSFTGTIILPGKLIRCPGACRALGLNSSDDDEFAHKISEKTGIPVGLASQVIIPIPRLDKPITAITLGRVGRPDVVISYPPPKAAMLLVRQWQEVNGADLDVSLSTFIAICGNVAVKAFKLQRPRLSLGCPESREYGRIADDRQVFGMPYHQAKQFVQERASNAHIRI